ncbi:MAG TPA: hypothetical protein DCM25_03950 [Rhodobacteraceae bacterium]|nr:hypothetical protein [Paracoccaceae bacterium]|tara:strand:- start:958 stop:1140 length:183 start_codon:yes stop_codon:yes gene_type:complete
MSGSNFKKIFQGFVAKAWSLVREIDFFITYSCYFTNIAAFGSSGSFKNSATMFSGTTVFV